MNGWIATTGITQISSLSIITLMFIFCLGGCFGSFANAAAMRLARGEDFIRKPSRCRTCHRSLHCLENLPFVGWLRQCGRCHCGKIKLPYRYVIVELAFGILFVIYALTLPVMAAIGFSIAAIFIVISMLTDAETMSLHPVLLGILALIGLGFSVIGSGIFAVETPPIGAWHISPSAALAGCAVGGATPLTINLLYRLMRGQNGFGEGDFWMLGAIGAWIGWQGALSVLVLAAATGALVGLFMILSNKASIFTRLPFGVFLGGVFILWSIFLI